VVRTRYPEKNWSFKGSGHISYAVDFDIVAPETMPVTARNRFGDVTIDGVKADTTVSNANGKVAVTTARVRRGSTRASARSSCCGRRDRRTSPAPTVRSS
jgi:hypothetical protein